MSNSFVDINRCIKTKYVTEFIITDGNYNKSSVNHSDDEFNIVKNILSKSKVTFFSKHLLEYDTEKNTIELRCNNNTKKFYMYKDETGNGVMIIVKDFFQNSDTPTKLDYPYYFVANISFTDYYKIFPNSTLISQTHISTNLSIKKPKLEDNTVYAKLHVRNDNDCNIKLEGVKYSDNNISIDLNQSQKINSHSDSDIKINIIVKNNPDKIIEYVNKGNVELEFFSVDNPKDRVSIFCNDCVLE